MKNKLYNVALAISMLILLPIALFNEPEEPHGYAPTPIPYVRYACIAMFIIMGYFLLRSNTNVKNIISILSFFLLNFVVFAGGMFAMAIGHDPDGSNAKKIWMGLAVLVATSAYFLIYVP